MAPRNSRAVLHETGRAARVFCIIARGLDGRRACLLCLQKSTNALFRGPLPAELRPTTERRMTTQANQTRGGLLLCHITYLLVTPFVAHLALYFTMIYASTYKIFFYQNIERFVLAGAPWCGASRLPAEASASPAPPKVQPRAPGSSTHTGQTTSLYSSPTLVASRGEESPSLANVEHAQPELRLVETLQLTVYLITNGSKDRIE